MPNFRKIYNPCLKYYLSNGSDLKSNFYAGQWPFSFKLISTDMLSMLDVDPLFKNLDGISS